VHNFIQRTKAASLALPMGVGLGSESAASWKVPLLS
jgi:hypothetical protein